MNRDPQLGRSVAGASGVPGNLLQAWEQARLSLRSLDPARAAQLAGAHEIPGGVSVKYLRGIYCVCFSCGEVTDAADPDRSVDAMTSTVLAHYLLTADGRPLSQTFASYREFPGAAIYYGPFAARTVRPLARIFGAEPERLLAAGTQVGAKPHPLGDAAVTWQVLPRLPVTYAVWRGDDEVAASGSVLFDLSAPGYLPLEDLVVAAAQGAYALIKASAGREGA